MGFSKNQSVDEITLRFFLNRKLPDLLDQDAVDLVAGNAKVILIEIHRAHIDVLLLLYPGLRFTLRLESGISTLNMGFRKPVLSPKAGNVIIRSVNQEICPCL